MKGWRRGRGVFWEKTAISLGIIALGCILLIEGLKSQIEPNMDDVSQLKAKAMVTEIVSQTMEEELADQNYGDNLFVVKTGENGEIQMVQSNTGLINGLVSSFASALQEKYNSAEPQDMKLSYGTLIGSKVLSQTGLSVNIRILPLSVAECDFETEFESQGINQTKYKIYVTIETNVRVLQPFSSNSFKVKNKVLIAETVIVGDVPDSYVNVPKEDILDAIN